MTAVRGTRFRVAQDAQASRHEVLEGRVAAQGAASSAPVEIAQGAGLRAQDGQLGSVVRLLPAPDLSAIPTRIERTSQLLQVPAMAGAAAWRWQVARDGAFVQRVQEARTTAPAWLLTDLPDGSYQLRVRAADAQTLEGVDAQVAFVLQARPEAPLRLGPPDEASVIAGTALAWADRSGSPAYRLQVARDPQFADKVFDQGGIRATRQVMDPPLAPGVYHWRLATERPDGKPRAHGVTRPASRCWSRRRWRRPNWATAACSWTGPDRPVSATRCRCPATADFAQAEFDQVVAGSSLNLPKPAPGTYHVRTRLVLPDGSRGPWSAVQRFEVAPPPAPPSHPWYLLLIPLLLPLL